MTNADKIYVDPSALRRAYIHEPRSRAFCTWMARIRGPLPLTLHGKAELVNSIELAVFRRDITSNVADGALADLGADLSEGRLAIVDVPWRRALDRATELSRLHTSTLGTRTLDVLHVASALELGCKIFVTYDERQAALAKAVRFRIACP